MKTLRKLTMLAIMAVCAVCLVFGLVGCNGGEEEPPAPHEHTFAEEWTADGENGHYHLATCHDNVKSETEPHVDEDNDGKCDKCDYEMAEEPPAPHEHTFAQEWIADGENGHYHLATCHDNVKSETEPHEYNAEYKCTVCDYQHTHTFNMTEWESDASNHWHASTCGHEVKNGEAPHVDEDDDQFCDECNEFVPHEHKYDETTWLYDEAKHWHPSTCHAEDPTVKGSEAEHVFTEGVCACGVKEEETEAYDVLTEKEIIDDDFYTWLTGIKADDVTEVRVTEQGDVIYDRDGEVEGVYIADRTVRVKVRDTDGNGVKDAWVKLAYDNNDYINQSGTNALVVAQTDVNGDAELTFTPVGGYTSSTVKYLIRFAEAKDVALLNSVDEEDVKVLPNRYTVGSSVSATIEVGENDTSGDIIGNLELKFDKSWSAADKIMLDYARYPANALAGTNITEVGQSMTLQASGNDLFDYMLFVPSQKYSWKQGDDVEDFDTITENFRNAASGVYTISFIVPENVEARLYHWNDIDLGLKSTQKADGTPLDTYVTSVSGSIIADSSIAESKFTGENNIVVTIAPENGLSQFQLGLICNTPCEVTITIAREEYVPEVTGGTLQLGENNTGDELGYKLKAYEPTEFKLSEFENGLYNILVTPISIEGTTGDDNIPYTAGGIVAYTSEDKQSVLWKDNAYEGYIRITDSDTTLTLINGTPNNYYVKITISEYSIPVLKLDEVAYLPAFGLGGEEIEIPFDETVAEASVGHEGGAYTFALELFSTYVTVPNSDGVKPDLALKVGEQSCDLDGSHCSVDIESIVSGDSLKLAGYTTQVKYFIVKVTLSYSSFPKINLNEDKEFDYLDFNADTDDQRVVFIAPESGTYKVTITLVEAVQSLIGDTPAGLKVLSVIDETDGQKNYYLKGETSYNRKWEAIEEVTCTFTADADAKLTLNFRREYYLVYMKISVKIEKAE